MAATKYPPPSPEVIAGDLLVHIFPRECDRWEGSSALLVAEGLIPAEFEWPSGKNGKSWEVAGWNFWLRRCRPPGLKGPMRLWVNGDWWWLQRRRVTDRAAVQPETALVYEKRQALEAEIKRCSPEGQRMLSRYFKAYGDQKFQAFKRRAMGAPT